MTTPSFENYIPKTAVPYILEICKDTNVRIKISKTRLTKLGDFRTSIKKGAGHTITINGNLNPYAFLLTLIHEIAHLHVWLTYKNKHLKPHGVEWKKTFEDLLMPILFPNNDIIPDALQPLILKHLQNPKSSIAYDAVLMKALSKYDPHSENNGHIILQDVKENTTFMFRKRSFIKKESIRTRSKCLDTNNKQLYLIHNSAKVKIVEN